MPELDLPKFLPFRLNRLAAEMSTRLAEVYSDRFGIDIVEWRILVTLADQQPCSAQAIVQSTRTHKSRISRGVSRMTTMGLVAKTDSQNDRRQAQLRLTATGKALHKKLVPVVLEQECSLLACLSADELAAFSCAMEKLERSMTLIEAPDEKDS